MRSLLTKSISGGKEVEIFELKVPFERPLSKLQENQNITERINDTQVIVVQATSTMDIHLHLLCIHDAHAHFERDPYKYGNVWQYHYHMVLIPVITHDIILVVQVTVYTHTHISRLY